MEEWFQKYRECREQSCYSPTLLVQTVMQCASLATLQTGLVENLSPHHINTQTTDIRHQTYEMQCEVAYIYRETKEDYTLCGALATSQKNTVLSGGEPKLKTNSASPSCPAILSHALTLGSKMLVAMLDPQMKQLY